MKKQTIINYLNKRIKFWEEEKKTGTTGGQKRSKCSWIILELKWILEKIKKLD